MKVIVLYDDEGVIESIGCPAEELAGELSLQPQPGQRVLEVDIADLGLDTRELSAERLYRHLPEIPRSFRVAEGRLERAPEPVSRPS